MIKAASKRAIFRWIHIGLAIPILGYIYSPFAEIPNYAGITRFVFVPLMMLAGYWMYAGVIFAIVGVALWLGAFRLSGLPNALLTQIALFIIWKIWMMTRARQRRIRNEANE